MGSGESLAPSTVPNVPPSRRDPAHGVRDAQRLAKRIRDFLSAARKPVLVESGVPAIELRHGHYRLDERAGVLYLEAWSDAANIVRRLVEVRRASRTNLEIVVRKFGGRTGLLTITDEGARRSAAAREADRAAFRREFERLLERDYADWKITRLTAARDLEHSFSSRHVRGQISRGHEQWAVIACGRSAGRAAAEEILTPGLLWLERVRERSPSSVIRGLKIFVPRAWIQPTASRLAFLRRDRATFELWAIGPGGALWRMEPTADGNRITDLQPCLPVPALAGSVKNWCERLRRIVPVEEVPRPDGLWSLRVRGIEFARAGRSIMVFGLEGSEPVSAGNFDQVCQLARDLGRWRAADAPDTSHPLYRLRPESWLESQIRRHPQLIDPGLEPRPLYSQVAAVSGRDRPVIDLLGIDRHRRLLIAEVKAEEDLYLPLQALDYWIGVRHHMRAQTWTGEHYFALPANGDATPRLFLVAPALKFHPATEEILGYFSQEIEITRVGVDEGWRETLRVAFRLRGADRPAPLQVKSAGA